MHSKSDNIEIMINDETYEVIKELFDSLKNRYQNNLESVKGSEFVFNYFHLLYYKYHKINPYRGGSYLDSRDWIKSKKAAINPINKKDNKCIQNAVTVALNYEEITKYQQRITKIKPFINKYNWEGINFPSEKDDWKNFEKNNVTTALNFLYAKKQEVFPAYVSKHNSNREKQATLLMIPNGKKTQSEVQKTTMALSCSQKTISIIRGITSKHHGDFYCLNCLHSFPTEKKT